MSNEFTSEGLPFVSVWYQWSVLVRRRCLCSNAAVLHCICSAEDQSSGCENLSPGDQGQIRIANPQDFLWICSHDQSCGHSHADARYEFTKLNINHVSLNVLTFLIHGTCICTCTYAYKTNIGVIR